MIEKLDVNIMIALATIVCFAAIVALDIIRNINTIGSYKDIPIINVVLCLVIITTLNIVGCNYLWEQRQEEVYSYLVNRVPEVAEKYKGLNELDTLNAFKYEIENDPQCRNVIVLSIDSEGLNNPERCTYQLRYALNLEKNKLLVEK